MPKMNITGSRRVDWGSLVSKGDPSMPRSTTPAYESKSIKAETGGWGVGLGNNVSNTMRGVNAEPDRMAAEIDKTAKERTDYYRRQRKTDAYKLQRAEAKRKRKGMKFKAPGDATEDKDTTQTKRSNCFTNSAGRIENISGEPIQRKPGLGVKADPTMDTWGQRVRAFFENG